MKEEEATTLTDAGKERQRERERAKAEEEKGRQGNQYSPPPFPLKPPNPIPWSRCTGNYYPERYSPSGERTYVLG